MKRIRKFRREVNPLLEVVKARKSPGGIQVKVKLPMSGISGDANSNWLKMHMKYYWRGEKQFRVKKINGDVNATLKGAKVRIPKFEKEHRIAIRKQKNVLWRRNR